MLRGSPSQSQRPPTTDTHLLNTHRKGLQKTCPLWPQFCKREKKMVQAIQTWNFLQLSTSSWSSSQPPPSQCSWPAALQRHTVLVVLACSTRGATAQGAAMCWRPLHRVHCNSVLRALVLGGCSQHKRGFSLFLVLCIPRQAQSCLDVAAVQPQAVGVALLVSR